MHLNDQEKSNITYKGFKSVTFFLVLFGYISSTLLLIFAFIDAITWQNTAFGMLSAYVIRDGVSKIAEAYWNKTINENNHTEDVKPVEVKP